MQKINFQNLPNTTTPVNATNLNQLQTNVENAIPTKVSDLTNDSGFINKNDSSLFQYIDSAQYSANLNNALNTGQYFYTTDTLNSPYTQVGTTDQYGLVLVMSNTSDTSVSRWVFQIALTTWGNIFMRTNINNSGWSSWLKVHYQ